MSSEAYRAAHREELRAKQRAWREAHPDYSRAWREANADEVREYGRAYLDANRYAINERRRLRTGDRARVRREALEASAEERRQRKLAYIREWRASHPDRVARYRRYNQTRRARIAGALVEKVDRLAVYERDAGVCGICSAVVARDAFDLDHIVPLSRGGAHSYQNTQVAHPTCNRRKHNRVES